MDCQCIRSYSARDEEIRVVFEGKKLYPVCPGSGVDLFSLDDDNRIANLSWQPEQRQFKKRLEFVHQNHLQKVPAHLPTARSRTSSLSPARAKSRPSNWAS